LNCLHIKITSFFLICAQRCFEMRTVSDGSSCGSRILPSEVIGLPEGALLQKSGDRVYVFFPVYYYDKSAKKGLRGKQQRRYIGTVTDGKFVPNKFFLDNPDCTRTQLKSEMKSVRGPWEQAYRIIDLSYPVHEGMPVFPGDPDLRMKLTRTLGQDGYRYTEISTGLHLGTHIDAPRHVIDKGKAIDAFPIEHFMGSALVVDCRDAVVNGEIPVSVMDSQAKILGKVDFVLLRTGWEKHWGTSEYFSHPVPSAELCRALAARSYKGIGIDASSFDPVDSIRNHKTLLAANQTVLIENLCNLKALPRQVFTLSCLPLDLKDAEASFTRAIAILADDAV
jgi:kynurenine formamidase